MAGSVAARLALCAVGLAFAVAWLYRRRARLAAECRGRVEGSRAGAAARAGDGAGDSTQVELRLRVWKRGEEVEEIVRVRPDSVDLTAHTGLVALPEELRACAGRVRGLLVRSKRLKALPAWLGELTGLTELRVDGMAWNHSQQELPDAVGQLTTPGAVCGVAPAGAEREGERGGSVSAGEA
jgi:hypothetical protein